MIIENPLTAKLRVLDWTTISVYAGIYKQMALDLLKHCHTVEMTVLVAQFEVIYCALRNIDLKTSVDNTFTT